MILIVHGDEAVDYVFVLFWVAKPAHLPLLHDHESNFQIVGDPCENLQILQFPPPLVHLAGKNVKEQK
jgi:hypothetical protein